MGDIKKDVELAAKLGKEISGDKQAEYIERIKRETAARAEEIRREKELLALQEEEAKRKAAEPEIVLTRRQRREMMLSQVNESVKEENEIIEDNEIQEIHEEVTQDIPKGEPMTEEIKEEQPVVIGEKQPIAKDMHKAALFKPVAPGKRKTKIEELPSYFLSYPEGAEIWIIPYSGDDIDELNSEKLSLKYIMTKCLEGVFTNFDKKQLTFYDVLYLSYYRRILSINDNIIAVTSQCPYCEKYSTRETDINKDISFEDSRIPKLPINIDFSFGTLSFSYLTYENYMKMNTNLDSEELAYQCINDIDFDKEKYADGYAALQSLFGSLVGEDLALLREVKRLTYHGVKPIQTLCQNKECGKTFETMVNEWEAIITPFRSSREDIRSKVSFG